MGDSLVIKEGVRKYGLHCAHRAMSTVQMQKEAIHLHEARPCAVNGMLQMKRHMETVKTGG